MEEFDRDTEQQVWQRVFARQEEARGEELRSLIRTSMELAERYQRLAGAVSGRPKELARKLYEGELANAACLKGIAQLSGSREEAVKPWDPGKEPVRRVLEKCYHRTRRCLTEYMARSPEADWGVVYQQLAKRAEIQCARIAELLGSLPHTT